MKRTVPQFQVAAHGESHFDRGELLNAIIGALDAHTALSTQALDSEPIRDGLKKVLLGPAQLYSLRR